MDTWRAQADRNSKRCHEFALTVGAHDGDDGINFEEFTELIGVCTNGTYSKRQTARLFRDALKGAETLRCDQFVSCCYVHGLTVPIK
jgi:hypothetical protein